MTTGNTSRNTPDRMDLPFVGLATLGRQPACPDCGKFDDADVAVLGVSIDTASSYRVGTRFGPRAIREISMLYDFGPKGVFDFEDEVTYLIAGEVKIVDVGDSDAIYADTKRSLANAEQAVRALATSSANSLAASRAHSTCQPFWGAPRRVSARLHSRTTSRRGAYPLRLRLLPAS
jgi:agmatinase